MKTTQLIFIAVAALLAIACGKTEIKTYARYQGPMLVGYNIYTNYTDSGKVKMRMWAPEQQEMETGNQVFPKGVKIDFYGKDGKVSSVLTAKEAYFDKLTGNYTVKNNVEIQSKDQGKKLNTEELKWLPKKHRVLIEKQHFVRIQTPTEVLTGNGLEATEDFTWYKITKPKGVFAVSN
jgi:LPS export ABC transporter protein LptC